MSIRVERAGALTTIQDLGDPSGQDQGVPQGGAMDAYAARLCNLLVGNEEDATVLEATLTGPALVVERETIVAIGGGDFGARLDGEPLPLWKPVPARAGARLELGTARTGCRSYLAFGGGIALRPGLPLRSPALTDRAAGPDARPLRAGDVLPLGNAVAARPGLPLPRSLLPAPRPAVRIVAGRELAALPDPARTALLGQPFRILPSADRMGYRLAGPPLAFARPLELLSSAVTMGTVQLPPDGNPIVLMADRQTTGGYPRIGQVASVDLGAVAQLRPGDELRFELISLDEAQAMYLERESGIAAFRRALEATR